MIALNRVPSQSFKAKLDHAMTLIKKTLMFLHIQFLQAQRFSYKKPKPIIYTSLICFILLSIGSYKLQFILSIDDLIDPDFSTYQSLQNLNRDFKDKNTIVLSVESERIFDKSFLCDIQKWMKDKAETRNDLIKIQSTFGIRQAKIDGNYFEMDSFLKLDCYSKSDESAKIAKAFAEIKKSPWSSILSTPQNYALTLNFIVYDPQDKKFGSINTKIANELESDFENHFSKYKEVKSFWGGVTVYQSHLRRAFDQTQLLNGLMLLLSLLIFRIFLGCWMAGIIFNTSVLFTLGISYGIMGYLQIPVDVMTNATGLMVLVSCLEDFVFVTFGMLKFKWSLRKSLRKFLFPSFFTSLTTAIGFGSLVTSDLSIIQRFGVISAIAIILEWISIFIILPAFIKLFSSLNHFKFHPSRVIPKDPFQKSMPRWISYVLILLVSSSFFFWERLKIQDAPGDFFFKKHIINQVTEHFYQTRSWVNDLSLVFNNNLTVERKDEVIKKIRSIPLITSVEYSTDVKEFLSQNVSHPSDRDMIDQLWENSSHSSRLIATSGTERAQIYIKDMSNESIAFLKEQIQKICHTDCEVVGSLISYNEFSMRVLSTLFSSLGISLILVIFILIILSPHIPWRTLCACIVSSMWGPLALLALFIIFQLPLFFVSCICASVLVGLAGDNAIQFIYFSNKGKIDHSIDDLYEGSLIVTIGMMMMTSVFFLSQLAPLAKLGIFILLGFALTYLGDVWILRGLLNNKKEK